MSPGQDLSLMDPERLAASSLMPPHLRDDPVATYIMMTTLQAYRLAVTFMAFKETYTVPKKDARGNVIAVTPGLMAKLQQTIAYRRGWSIRPAQDATPELAVVRIRERRARDSGDLIRFSMADAVRAKLPDRNPNYGLYPDRMLHCRAVTKAIGLICPEVLFDPDLPDLADEEEWRAIESAGPSVPSLPLEADGPAVPDYVYDDEPEAYADPTGEKYDPDDPQRPFTD